MTITTQQLKEKFKAYIVPESYLSIVSYPELKSVESVSWAEHSGLDVDLSNPMLEKKNIQIKFFLKDKQLYNDFHIFLMQELVVDWIFEDIGRKYTLRLLGFSSYEQQEDSCFCSVDFSEDNPVLHKESQRINAVKGSENWSLDGKPFFQYGIYVLETAKNIIGQEQLKQVLEISNQTINGVVVKGQKPKKKEQDINIPVFLKADIKDFWCLYDGFFSDLIKPQKRQLQIQQQTLSCYYLSSSVSLFYKQEDILFCEANITMKVC